MPLDLTISLINHSNPELLHECLRSIYASTHEITFDIWVVDNATNRRGVAEMQAEFPNVHWLFNEYRLGFSANHNQVLSRPGGRYVCILNDDTIIHDGMFDLIIEYMDQNPSAGMVGPRVLNADGSHQNCAFRFMNLWSELISLTLLPESLCRLKWVGIDPAQQREQAVNVDWLLGACMVVRETALRRIGLLDSVLSPIANTEEVDWCYRAHKLGWDVVFLPDAKITHFGGQSMNVNSPEFEEVRIEIRRTHLVFFRKHYGLVAALALRFLYSATLPWNLFMLRQSLVRGRITRDRFDLAGQTLRQIAGLHVPRVGAWTDHTYSTEAAG